MEGIGWEAGRLTIVFRPFASFRLSLRIFLARCHSKCHSLRAPRQILLSKRAFNSFAKPYGVTLLGRARSVCAAGFGIVCIWSP